MTSKIPEILASVRNGKHPISCKDFDVILNKELENDIDPSAFHELLKFLSEQCGTWSANWNFSHEASPDLSAKSEYEQWEQLWQASANAFAEHVSIPADEIQREHNLIVLQESIHRRIDFNKTNTVERTLAAIYSFFAIQLNKIGVKGVANSIYIKSLYPKGTVGRVI